VILSTCNRVEVYVATSFSDLDRHPAEFFEYLLAPMQWPPIIQVNLHWPPHRYPTSNGEAFSGERGKSPHSREELAQRQTNLNPALVEEESPGNGRNPGFSAAIGAAVVQIRPLLPSS
jgi:Glutamyl-tRNAGlu reductase, N-terminal domain